ncbi:MAG: AAA family ATPase [Elusimicrobiota bacterium]|nr:AAA family ATPase [Elusimicrobiota bacterium]
MPDAESLAQARRGYVAAAAGCGKTQLISEAVASHPTGRQLVLTHTHAGVDALRARLERLGARLGGYSVQTIAGFSLSYASAFPRASSLASAKPKSQDEWKSVYSGLAAVLKLPAVQKVIKSSYAGLYVDEYQDCTKAQHGLMMSVADLLPTRVLGDPLQGIFDFGDNDPVDWEADVKEKFQSVCSPDEPRRWAGKNEVLGAWLKQVRTSLINGQPIDLRHAAVRFVDTSRSVNPLLAVGVCQEVASQNPDDTVVAIHHRPQQCHWVANKLNGRYSCIEPIESGELLKFAESLASGNGAQKASAAIEFAGKCMTVAAPMLRGAQKTILKGGKPRSTKAELAGPLAALDRVVSTNDLVNVAAALEVMKEMPKAVIYRRELLDESLRALREYDPAKHQSVADAFWAVRNRTRQMGRRIPRCSVGRTLLIKGLEFDHAVILDADALSAKDLYVALTRGCKSLTILGKSPVVQFAAIAA